MTDRFQVDQIDHIEVFVPDRYEAAQWYEKVLGLKIVKGFKRWSYNPHGPLMIATPKAKTKLALFNGEPQLRRKTAGSHCLAFRVSGKNFLKFLDVLKDLKLPDDSGRILTSSDYHDYTKAFSIYFCDPWGHRFEITTYEHETVRANLKSLKI
jgi:catechol 2,3-dioxygenase-like lactoylglutathione lyase family enzyme